MVIMYCDVSGRSENVVLFVFYLGEYYYCVDGIVIDGDFFCGRRGDYGL